ncbi:hypothetical protein [Aureibaculum luteum]|uniref:hypothetical protein n=1 Tax=Aureibaculum luteum TaxID=1548456 RepID=UPI000E4761D3|nr:hypothetical protein [Aureibaculum luteum]
MNVGTQIIKTAFKSTLLATSLLYFVILGLNGVQISDPIPFLPICLIVIFIFSMLGVSFTIVPFYYLGKKDQLPKIGKRFFPLYTILSFSFCLMFITISGFMAAIVILGIAYITAMFAWMWFFYVEHK